METAISRPIQKNIARSSAQESVLKILREKKKISRVELSRMTRLSPYQVEGLEGKYTQNVLDRFFSCANALGYGASDVLKVMQASSRNEPPSIMKGVLSKPLSVTKYDEGINISIFIQGRESFFGILQLGVSKDISVQQIYTGDFIFGIVKEGTLVVDHLLSQTVHKRDSFFVLPGALPARFINGDSFVQTSLLLFSMNYSA